jgi:hypothetical protein
MREMKTEFRSREVASPALYSEVLIMVPRPNNLIEVFCLSPQSAQANVGKAPKVGHDRFLSISVAIYYSLIVVPFDAIEPQLTTRWLIGP